MLATGCVKFDRLGQALNAKVIVLVAASIVLGRALTAAAAVGTPIAVSLWAEKLAIPTEPLVLAVLFGCNLCYATPIACQTHTLIMSAGVGYHFRNYVRAVLPLVLLMICTPSVLLVWKYGL